MKSARTARQQLTENASQIDTDQGAGPETPRVIWRRRHEARSPQRNDLATTSARALRCRLPLAADASLILNFLVASGARFAAEGPIIHQPFGIRLHARCKFPNPRRNRARCCGPLAAIGASLRARALRANGLSHPRRRGPGVVARPDRLAKRSAGGRYPLHRGLDWRGGGRPPARAARRGSRA